MKTKLGNEPSTKILSNDFERDDDDPLSIRSFSIAFFGIMIAFLTILLPLISVFVGRPLSHKNEIIFNHSIKKDGP